MTTEDAFLHAIEREPEDESHRLVYADWLDEQGQQIRAELLRVQCALAHLPDQDEDVAGLRARERGLLRELQQELPEACRSLDDFCFDRGVVVSITLDIPAFLEHADKLCAWLHVRAFHVFHSPRSGARPDLAALVEHPHFGRVRRLELRHSVLMAGDLRPLVDTPAAEGLEELQLEGNLLGPEGAEALAQTPYLDQLTVLGLAGNGLGDLGVQSLVESPYLSRLKVLDLGHNSITDWGLATLAVAPFLERLSLLDLRHNAITNVGVCALSGSSHLRLTGLNLASNFLSDRAVQHLANAPFGERLKGLDLHGNQITHAGLAALGRSPYLNHLLKDALGR